MPADFPIAVCEAHGVRITGYTVEIGFVLINTPCGLERHKGFEQHLLSCGCALPGASVHLEFETESAAECTIRDIEGNEKVRFIDRFEIPEWMDDE